MIGELMFMILMLIIYIIFAAIQVAFVYKHDNHKEGYYIILTVIMIMFTVAIYMILIYLFTKYNVMV